MAKKLPVVAIIGRANVGKSSLFNRIVGERRAIVADEAGTTRDSVTAVVKLDDAHSMRLVDTAGLKRAEDEFEASIQDQIFEATEAANLILMVVEAATQMTDEDHRIAKLALKSKTPTLLVINKVDQAATMNLELWAKTGISRRIRVSAIHGTGLDYLEQALLELLPLYSAKQSTDAPLRVALIGRPNVGKSHLFNALAKKQQAIVAPIAGTTRDVNRTELVYKKQRIELLDTAGLRRPGKVERGVEHFSVLRTMAAIDEADVALLLMDANELNVTMDQKLAQIIADSGKGLMLVVSKWDSIEKDAYTQISISSHIAGHYQHVAWAPLLFTSAVTDLNVTKIFEQVVDIQKRRVQKFETKDLNKLLRAAVLHHPPAGPAGRKIYPKLKYATQTGANPPEVTVYGRNARKTHWSYERYLEKSIRETWDLAGVPIKLWFKDQEEKETKQGK